MLEGERNSWIMTVGAGELGIGVVNSVSSEGLVAEHAYSLLSVHEVKTK
jgi:hypothetical protein